MVDWGIIELLCWFVHNIAQYSSIVGWRGFLELMESSPVKIERIYNEKPGRYDEPIGAGSATPIGVSIGGPIGTVPIGNILN